jgi:hypothetical protein
MVGGRSGFEPGQRAMHRSRGDPSMAWGLSAIPAVHSLPQRPQDPQASRTMVAGNFRLLLDHRPLSRNTRPRVDRNTLTTATALA